MSLEHRERKSANPVAEASGHEQGRRLKRRWPLKTLVEILPVIIALTALFSWTSIRRVSDEPLVMMPSDVIGTAPAWVVALLVAVACVMFGGMGLLLFIYTRAPVNSDGPAESALSPEQETASTSYASAAASERDRAHRILHSPGPSEPIARNGGSQS